MTESAPSPTGARLAPWVLEALACPDCGGAIRSDLACACGFQGVASSPLDLRPSRPRDRVRTVRLSAPPPSLEGIAVERPPVTYRGPRPSRDSRELLSAGSDWIRRGARMLDLGCGPRDQAVAATHLGVDYVGVDFSSDAADVRADAHALPFQDGTFDVVLSYAVLEHLRDPFLAAAEVARVLRSGGALVGTVSQGEPFHDSYFHHTAWGLLSVLSGAGLTLTRLWPSYDTLHALSGMGRYPRVQRWLIEAVHRFGGWTPFLAPRKFFRGTAREKALDRIHRAAGLCFVAVREPAVRT